MPFLNVVTSDVEKVSTWVMIGFKELGIIMKLIYKRSSHKNKKPIVFIERDKKFHVTFTRCCILRRSDNFYNGLFSDI